MGVAVLYRSVQAPQEVAVGAGDVGSFERIEDGLVVLVHEHHGALARSIARRFDEAPETHRRWSGGVRPDAHALFEGLQMIRHVLLKVIRLLEIAAAEAQAQHRVAHGPAPLVVDVQPLEQGFIALEQFLQRVQKQLLPKRRGRDRK